MKKYLEILKLVLAHGEQHADRTGVGTISICGHQNRYDLSAGFPLLTTKKMALKSIITELMWFIQGRTDNQWLVDRGCTIWNEWATAEACAKYGRRPGDLGPIYGHQWRHFGQPYVGPVGWPYQSTEPDGSTKESGSITYSQQGDQLKTLCDQIRTNPGSRRLIVTGWNPLDADKVALPPCHTLWQVKISDGKLNLHLFQRSADAFLGVPFNIASYAILTHLLAVTHGYRPGTFVHTCTDLHIYNNHRDQVTEQLSREPYQLPQIRINDALANRGLDGLLDFQHDDLELLGYNCHPSIKAPVAV